MTVVGVWARGEQSQSPADKGQSTANQPGSQPSGSQAQTPSAQGSSTQAPSNQEPAGEGVRATQAPTTPSPATPAPEKIISPQEAKELFRSVDELIQFASGDTGLPIKHEVKRKLADRQEVESYLDKGMKDDKDAKRLERSSEGLKKFGLIPRDFQLEGAGRGILRSEEKDGKHFELGRSGATEARAGT